jgi:hypothetical protein
MMHYDWNNNAPEHLSMAKYFNSGLRLKLVALVVIGIVSAFTVFGVFQVQTQKQRIAEEMRWRISWWATITATWNRWPSASCNSPTSST